MTPKLDAIKEAYPDDAFVIMSSDEPEYDEAILGMDERSMRVIYSTKKVIEILASKMEVKPEDLSPDEIKDQMTIEQKQWELAYEYFGFNIEGAYVKGGPIFCNDLNF